MTKIEVNREDRTIYVDESMTPAELENFLLEKAMEEQWVSVTIDDDKDPQVVTQGDKVPLNE